MYTPPAFRVDEVCEIHAAMRDARSATLVTMTSDGLIGTLVPMLLDANEGTYGTLYAHVARANSQWWLVPQCEAMAIFQGPEAYITPSWYATKKDTHRVVPTWNYLAVHAYGTAEFFDDADRLLNLVTQLTSLHEAARTEPWNVTDAPTDFMKAQLKGIVGLRMPITRLDGKRKMSQNRSAADRTSVVAALSASDRAEDRIVATMISDA